MLCKLIARVVRAFRDSPARVYVPSVDAQDMDSPAVRPPEAADPSADTLAYDELCAVCRMPSNYGLCDDCRHVKRSQS